MKFSLLHATARLPEGWRAAHDAWMARAKHPENVEYLLCVDSGVTATREVQAGGHRLVFNTDPASPVSAWNTAAKHSTGDVLIVLADDLFPCEGWDEKIEQALKHLVMRSSGAVLEVSYGGTSADQRRLIIHPILTRAYYERYGYVFFPEYFSMYCDDDFTAQARQDQVVLDARHIVFEHRHPTNGSLPDAVYRRSNANEKMEQGRAIFERRWHKNQARSLNEPPVTDFDRLCAAIDKKEGKPSVLIAVLCGMERHYWIEPSLYAASLAWQHDKRFRMAFQIIYGHQTVEAARNAATEECINGKYDFLLMLDNDTQPMTAERQIINLMDLPALDLDIVSAPVPVIKTDGQGQISLNVYKRAAAEGIYFTGYGDAELQYAMQMTKGVIEADALGSAAICIKREVLEAVRNSGWLPDEIYPHVGLWGHRNTETGLEFVGMPYPAWVFPKDAAGYLVLSEDVLFCMRAMHLGYKCFSSLNHLCGHGHSLDHAITVQAKAILSEEERHQAGGYYCQNCSRVLCEKQGDICSACRELLQKAAGDQTCRQCGRRGWGIDEFLSPHSGLCAYCDPQSATNRAAKETTAA